MLEKLRYTDDKALSKLVFALAALKREGAYWDFKREWHDNTLKLLHDIICMANNPSNTTGMLIIGIDESAGYEPTGSAELLGKRRNTQQLTDMLNSKRWAYGVPHVRVFSFELDGCAVDVVLVDHDDDSVPYYLDEDYREGKETVRAGVVYSRKADSNTPLNGVASTLAVERLWRRRFGLDETPLERLPQLLKEPSKWIHTLPVLARDEEYCGYCYCHVGHPKFTYVRRPEEDWDGLECFMLASPFFREPNWWTGYFYYHQTLICRMNGAYSDHLWIPQPHVAALRKDKTSYLPEDAHFYGYYLAGSLERVAMLFELDESKEGPSAMGEVNWLDLLVPTYRDESERAAFEEWVVDNWETFLARCENQTTTRCVPKKLGGSTGRFGSAEQHARESATLVELLKEYRVRKQATTTSWN